MMVMKKSDAQILPRELAQTKSRQKSRRSIHWLLRLAVSLVLLALAAVALAAFWATQQAVTISLPTRVYQADRQVTIDDQVITRTADGQMAQAAGEGQVYVSALAQAVQPVFHYSFTADSIQPLTASSQIQAVLRIFSTKGQNQLLFEDSQILAEPQVLTEITNQYQLDRSAELVLSDYQARFQAFASQSPLSVRGELVIQLLAKTEIQLPSGLATVLDQPSVTLPLTSDTFTLAQQTRLKPLAIWRALPYQVVLTTVHPAVFPAVAALFLLGLVFWLRLTQSRRKDPFERKLAAMKRQCRGRLMLIADKAWEPEWCITTSDFQTMVRTAKKLKHPIFCHVDRQGAFPVAYFYVYYGENNYCLTFAPEGASALASPDSFAEPAARALPEIPVLPEMPEPFADQASAGLDQGKDQF